MACRCHAIPTVTPPTPFQGCNILHTLKKNLEDDIFLCNMNQYIKLMPSQTDLKLILTQGLLKRQGFKFQGHAKMHH